MNSKQGGAAARGTKPSIRCRLASILEQHRQGKPQQFYRKREIKTRSSSGLQTTWRPSKPTNKLQRTAHGVRQRNLPFPPDGDETPASFPARPDSAKNLYALAPQSERRFPLADYDHTRKTPEMSHGCPSLRPPPRVGQARQLCQVRNQTWRALPSPRRAALLRSAEEEPDVPRLRRRLPHRPPVVIQRCPKPPGHLWRGRVIRHAEKNEKISSRGSPAHGQGGRKV